jgi:GNAT superfamily N-acetyltransferase
VNTTQESAPWSVERVLAEVRGPSEVQLAADLRVPAELRVPADVRLPAELQVPAAVRLRRTCVGDTAGLTSMLAELSPASSYFRFLTGLGRPSDRLVARLLHRDSTHGAWLAVVGDAPVGHVMWALADDAVELGAVVTDAWQRRGIGRRLVQVALAEAAVAGAVAVRLDVHLENRPVVAMIRRAMRDALVTREAEMLTFRAPMTAATRVRPTLLGA